MCVCVCVCVFRVHQKMYVGIMTCLFQGETEDLQALSCSLCCNWSVQYPVCTANAARTAAPAACAAEAKIIAIFLPTEIPERAESLCWNGDENVSVYKSSILIYSG